MPYQVSNRDKRGGPPADVGLRIIDESSKHTIKVNSCRTKSGGYYRSISIYSGKSITGIVSDELVFTGEEDVCNPVNPEHMAITD